MHIATEDCIDAFLNLTKIFKGMLEVETNEPEGAHLAGYPYLVVPPPENMLTIAEDCINLANISNVWGLEVQN
jgi:hypothetical protein